MIYELPTSIGLTELLEQKTEISRSAQLKTSLHRVGNAWQTDLRLVKMLHAGLGNDHGSLHGCYR